MGAKVIPISAMAPEAQGPTDWFSLTELADLALPGLPGDRRVLARRARDERWAHRVGAQGEQLSRPRVARGGGTEFHVSILPGGARLELAARGLCLTKPEPATTSPAADAWRWYESRTAKVKAEAERRNTIISEIDTLTDAGATRTMAVAEGARRHAVSQATLWTWLKLVEGVAKHDRLPALAPRRQGGGAEADIDADLWRIFLSDYLRGSEPTFTSCYDRTMGIAEERGLTMPSERSVRRKFEREVDHRIVLVRRKGAEALRQSFPAQRRTVGHLHALELVNIDGHKFDVEVYIPGRDKPVRPLMVTIQDIYSRKFVAWRICETENAADVRLTFARLFRDYGIPKGIVLDNGRAFASKLITGGAKSRFRFKIKEEEPLGLLTSLGMAIHWAMPFRGQSKPIERGFRDLCDSISRHPAFEGAYVGNSPTAKPHNRGTAKVMWDDFVAEADRGMMRHNAKLGRRTETAKGSSFDQTFAASYASAPIGKATPEQLRMALLAAEHVTVRSRTGEIHLFGNRYWAEGCSQLHGKRVAVRFDPDNLSSEVFIYDTEGRYLMAAQIIDVVRFDSVEAARTTAKRAAELRRVVRDGVEAERLMTAEAVAALQPAPATAPTPEPLVYRPVRHRGQTAAALKAVPDPQRAQAAQQHAETSTQLLAAFGKLKVVE